MLIPEFGKVSRAVWILTSSNREEFMGADFGFRLRWFVRCVHKNNLLGVTREKMKKYQKK